MLVRGPGDAERDPGPGGWAGRWSRGGGVRAGEAFRWKMMPARRIAASLACVSVVCWRRDSEQGQRVPGDPQVTLDQVVDRGFQRLGERSRSALPGVSGQDRGVAGRVDAGARSHPGAAAGCGHRPARWFPGDPLTGRQAADPLDHRVRGAGRVLVRAGAARRASRRAGPPGLRAPAGDEQVPVSRCRRSGPPDSRPGSAPERRRPLPAAMTGTRGPRRARVTRGMRGRARCGSPGWRRCRTWAGSRPRSRGSGDVMARS